ncbi:MAG: VRR-NUC domain-containing protein [Alphaproteobacteria bacterium]|nr:VRR-NUC domain-containing protein [Alphaproteobacteria bacterium]MCB9697870.1 VRR-NUC domain-containing protein [Alphaproteobacteria bacterium]
MTHPAVEDTHGTWSLGLERGGHLLTAGELRMARAALTLPEDAALVHVRWTGRVSDVVRAEGIDADQLRALWDAGLVDAAIGPRRRAEALTVLELAAICRSRGDRVGGRKAALVERVVARPFRSPARLVRVAARGLWARLERWAALSAWPDRGVLVAERLGHVRHPTYATTSGPSLHPDRRALLLWERALGLAEPDAILAALARGDGQGPAGLDLTRALRRRLREQAEVLQRADPAAASELYARLVAVGERPARVAARRALCLERAGRATEAWQVLRDAVDDASLAEGVAVVRTGRRLGRTLRRGFPPLPPRAAHPVRSLRLVPAASEGPRPLWQTPEGPRTVEQAVIEELAGVGRRALHDEGATLRTLGVLLLGELLFLPVPGALPVPRLPGPLDLGTRRFRERRSAAFEELLAAIDAGEGPDRVRAAWRAHEGTRLVHARWDAGEDTLVALAGALPPTALRELALAVADGVRRGGFPDLLVLDGPPVELASGWPRKLPAGVLVAEVKGPGDTLRDGQIAWLDALARMGVRAELWEVRPGP